MCSEWNLAPNENPKVGNAGLGAMFVSGTLMFFFKKCNPAEMLSLRKIRKLGITGWEQPLFMELCCFSKNVIGKHVSHMKNQQGGKSGLGATFVSGILRRFKKCHQN